MGEIILAIFLLGGKLLIAGVFIRMGNDLKKERLYLEAKAEKDRLAIEELKQFSIVDCIARQEEIFNENLDHYFPTTGASDVRSA